MKKVLLVSNAHAGSVSARAKEVISKALSADFKLEVTDTARRSHASELARDAVDRDFDAVVAFGGDGTINEVAQGLVGTDVALGILPGGSTNVMARSLGVPSQPIDATAFVAAHLRSDQKRRVPVGRVGDRYFVFSMGMGLDAEVVRRAEVNPEGKRRFGQWLWVKNAFKAGLTEYRHREPVIAMEVEGAEPSHGITVVCCNSRPFTYFKRFPVDVCPQARLDAGLDFLSLGKLSTPRIASLVWGLFVDGSHIRWSVNRYHHDVSQGRLTSTAALPVQVDGDYIGHWEEAEVSLRPDALDLLV